MGNTQEITPVTIDRSQANDVKYAIALGVSLNPTQVAQAAIKAGMNAGLANDPDAVTDFLYKYSQSGHKLDQFFAFNPDSDARQRLSASRELNPNGNKDFLSTDIGQILIGSLPIISTVLLGANILGNGSGSGSGSGNGGQPKPTFWDSYGDIITYSGIGVVVIIIGVILYKVFSKKNKK